MTKRKPDPLPVMTIGDRTLHLEMARGDDERRRGFMHRTHLSENDGMLFLYGGAEENHRFWMMNTLIPLDIVFVRRDGTIVNVVETLKWEDTQMDPGTRSESEAPCQYVLEVNFGWFRKNGFLDENGSIKPDVIVEIPAAFRVR